MSSATVTSNQSPLGKRYRTLTRDMEEDDEYGEVIHPPGSVFKVVDTQGENYTVAWEGVAVDKNGKEVPANGMWCLWTAEEIRKEAVEIG